SLGEEFQLRTLSFMLSQPMSRMQVWAEKFSITALAVISAVLVYYFSWPSVLQEDRIAAAFIIGFVLATLGSATYWTLTARSFFGGITLNLIVQWLIVVLIVVSTNRLGTPNFLTNEPAVALSIAG